MVFDVSELVRTCSMGFSVPGRIDVPAFVERFRAAQSIDLGSWFEGMAKLQPHPEMVFWAADEV